MSSPEFHFFLGVLQGQEPVLVQTLLAKRPLKASMKALSVGLPGRLKCSSTSPLPAEIREIRQPARHWHMEQTLRPVHCDAVNASSLSNVRAGTGPLEVKAPAASAGA